MCIRPSPLVFFLTLSIPLNSYILTIQSTTSTNFTQSVHSFQPLFRQTPFQSPTTPLPTAPSTSKPPSNTSDFKSLHAAQVQTPSPSPYISRFSPNSAQSQTGKSKKKKERKKGTLGSRTHKTLRWYHSAQHGEGILGLGRGNSRFFMQPRYVCMYK